MQERTQPGGRPVHTPTSPGEAELKGRGLDDDEANATKGRGNPLLRDSQPTRSHLSCSLIPGGWSVEGSGLSSGKVWGHRPGPAPWGVCAWELHLQPPSCGRRRTSRGPGAVTLVVLRTTSPDTPTLTRQHRADLDGTPSTSSTHVVDATGGPSQAWRLLPLLSEEPRAATREVRRRWGRRGPEAAESSPASQCSG